MNKMIISSVLACLLLTLSVLAATSVDISPATATFTANQADVLRSSFELANINATNNLTVTLPSSLVLRGTRQNATVAVAYNISSPVFMESLTNTTANLSATLPSSLFNDTYTGSLTFTANNSDTAVMNINVGVLASVSATMTSPAVTAVRGRNATATVTITNTGNTDLSGLTYSITNLVDTSNSSNTLSNTYVTLPGSFPVRYQGTNSTVVQIRVPSSQRNSTYRGNMTLSYNGVPANATLTVTVEEPSYVLSYSESPFGFGTISANSTKSKSVTVINSGNDAITNLRLQNTDVPGRYNLSINDSTSTRLEAGTSKSYILTVTIPAGESAGLRTLGQIQATSDQVNSSLSLSATVEGRLVIDRVEVDVSGETDSSVSEGDTISKDARPGDSVDFDVTVRNKFTSSEDIEIRDVIITVTISDIDDGDDLDEESSSFDIKANDDKDETISFTIPEDAEEDTYDVTIEVEGEDENGNSHDAEMHIKLSVEREKNKLIISKAQLQPSVMTCSRSSTLTVTVQNIGSNDQDNAVMTLTSEELGISTRDTFTLSENVDEDDNIYTKTLRITVPPAVEEGDYPIEARLYYDTDRVIDVENAVLTVAACSASGEESQLQEGEEAEEEITTPVILPPTSQQPTTVVASPFGPAVSSFRETTGYTALLIAANIVIVALIVVLFVQLFRKPKTL